MSAAIYTEANMNGRVFGLTTIVRKVAGKSGLWTCLCERCGNEFECPTFRIENGSAARNGCGTCGRVKRSAPQRMAEPSSYAAVAAWERGK